MVPRWTFTFRQGDDEPQSFYTLQLMEPRAAEVHSKCVNYPGDIVQVRVSHNDYETALHDAVSALQDWKASDERHSG